VVLEQVRKHSLKCRYKFCQNTSRTPLSSSNRTHRKGYLVLGFLQARDSCSIHFSKCSVCRREDSECIVDTVRRESGHEIRCCQEFNEGTELRCGAGCYRHNGAQGRRRQQNCVHDVHNTVLSLLQVWPSALLLVDCIDACQIGTLLTIKSAAVTVAVPAPPTFETWGAVFLTESFEFGERVSTDVAAVGSSEAVVRPERTWYFKICVPMPRQYKYQRTPPRAVIIIINKNLIIILTKQQLTS